MQLCVGFYAQVAEFHAFRQIDADIVGIQIQAFGGQLQGYGRVEAIVVLDHQWFGSNRTVNILYGV